jgi:hypothetical protein
MRTCEIQTGPEKKRIAWITHGRERRAYCRLALQLAEYERELATRAGVADVAHGFVAGRSPVTMGTAHVGYDVTVSLDLKDWFESVKIEQLINAGVAPARASRCCVGGVVRQGLPTSPAAANIAAVALDRILIESLRRCQLPWVYTRYADDICLSFRQITGSPAAWAWIGAVDEEARKMGWAINERKTRIQYASAGRRIICGLSVGETDVRATRRVRHRLRACQHARPGTNETRGLAEWAACKLPGSGMSRAHVTRRLSRGD